MKTIKFSLFAVAAMAAVSCLNEANPENGSQVNPNLVEVSLTAVGESDEETKAVFSGYPKIAWEGNEEISLLGTNTGNQKLTANEKGHQTTFTGYADVTDDVYYAVYPYDANVGLAYTTDDKGKEIVKITSVTVPAVQTATAGSFDPKAYIAVAKSTDKENLYFKAVGAFIKFQLEDAENVKSVTIVSNTNKNMACSAAVEIKDDGSVAHGSPYVDGTTNTSVKMVGDFVSGKHYFMVVRPQPYDGGITVYIEYKDGTVLSRKGESALYESGKARNYIRNLNILKKADFAPVTDLYALYEMGYDITVGNLVINKETHTAERITATEANTLVYNQLNNGGIYFLETTGEGSFNLDPTKNVAVTKDVILIGNSSEVPVAIDLKGKNVYHTAGTIALKNIELLAGSNTNYVFTNVNATSDAEAFILDNCVVTDLKKPLWYVNVENYNCKNIILIDSDVQLGGDSDNKSHIIDLGKTKSLSNEQIIIENCIFYHSSVNQTSRILNNSGNISSTAYLKFNNNTVFNLHSGVNAGIVHMAGASTVDFQNNLFDFWAINDVTNDGKFEYIVRIWKNTPTYNAENNHYWRRDKQTVESDKLAAYGNGNDVVYASTATSAITSGAYPFTSKVPSAGATR